MIERILNYIKTDKFINKMCYIICFIYLFFAMSFVIIDYSNSVAIEKQFDDLMAYTLSVNKKIEQEIINSENKSDENASTKPIFTDGKTALITSFNEVYNSKSFYLESTGKMTLEMLGVSLNVDLDYTVIRFSETSSYFQTSNYLNNTTAPAALKSAIEKSTNTAKRVFKKDNTSSYISTKSFINKQPDFSNETAKVDNSLVILPDSLFIINENTIKNISYYKIKYGKDSIKNYYVQAELDCDSALVDFSKYIEQSAECVKPPLFDNFFVTACLNSSGKIIGFNLDADITLCRDTPIGIKDCPCNMKFNFAVNNINETINYVVEGF